MRWLTLAILAPAILTAQEQTVASGVSRWRDVTAQSPTMLTGVTRDVVWLRTDVVTADAASHAKATHADVEELVIVQSGQVRVTVNGQSRVLGPGSVAIVMPGDVHDITSTTSAPAKFYQFAYRAKKPMDAARGRKAGGSFMVDWNDVVFQPHATGGVRRIFDRATAMFDRFEMHVSTLNAGLTNHAAHTHGAEELVVMRGGDVRMLIGEKRYDAGMGDLIFLASLVPHSLDNVGTSASEYFAFQWQ